MWLLVRQIPKVGYCGMGSFCNIQLWAAWLTTTLPGLVCIPWCAILMIKMGCLFVLCSHVDYFVIVAAPHIQRYEDYYSLINCLWHHTTLGHIYDVHMFQSIVMSQISLSNVFLLVLHDTVIDVLPSLTTTTKLMPTWRQIPTLWRSAAVIPSLIMG